ncbi:MAG: sigma-70 family RNA polymerase sigma factor [Candidatus Eremiobacteraeota bacterium]|nr:sigma-70 family RNA polymerase sigma factor [Candidatus Eremiobacteraeota bacterium]MBV8222450.1 sigma-70 family RNA polymerase sigma factor [Candidatus Eremiobacteraeota bacterium]
MTTHDVTDEQLMAALALSDLHALDALYDRYAKPAFALAYRIVGDRGGAEDVVQDAFLSAWRQAKSYRRERGSPRTWLMSIVHHRSIDRLRANASSGGTLSLDELPDGPAEAPGVWQQVWAGLRGDAVRRALEQLPPEQKKSIELAYFSGYTQSEIAGLMGVPLGTVKGRMRMGLQKLRAWLEAPELGLSGA